MKSIQIGLAEMEAGELAGKLQSEIATVYHRLAMFCKANPEAAEGAAAALTLKLAYKCTRRDDSGLIMIEILSDIKTSAPKTTKGITSTFAEPNEDGVFEPHALAGAGDEHDPRQGRLCKRDGSPLDSE